MSDKIVKAFESLKGHYIHITTQAELLNTSVIDSPGSGTKKKDASLSSSDRILFCNVIGDYMPLPSLRKLPEFTKLLSVSVELLLVACNDDDADVRLVAGEALNKLIKAFLDSHIGRILIEFYKEVKKNGPSRTLRAALQRFADVCHMIRPQKCRPYVVNLLPSIIKVTKREDDSIQEVLGAFMSKVTPTLGYSMLDSDVKVLLKSFMRNIKSPSAMIRRTAAASLNSICQNSRKPAQFYSYLVNLLIGLVCPLSTEHALHSILGVLLTFRNVVPHLCNEDKSNHGMKGSFGHGKSDEDCNASKNDGGPTVDEQQLLKVYEIAMYYTQHGDHNVVTASLEVLYQVLLSRPNSLVITLLSTDGMAPLVGDQVLQSEESFDTDTDDDICKSEYSDSGLDDDLQSVCDLSVGDTISGLSKKYGNQGDLDISSDSAAASSSSSIKDEDNDMDNDNDDSEFSLPRTYTSDSIVHIESDKLESGRTFTMQSQLSAISDVPENDVDPAELDEIMRLSSITSYDVNAAVELYLSIDAVTCTGVPLLHFIRVMCSFVLKGVPGCLLPDSKARVSVKSLALQCIALAMKLYPEGILARVAANQIESAEQSKQLVRDLLLTAGHPDPQIRGVASIVAGNFIFAALSQSGNDYNQWCNTKAASFQTDVLDISDAVDVIVKVLKDESSMASKQALVTAKTCLPSLLSSSYVTYGIKILKGCLELKDDGYWLIKVELSDVLSIMDFRLLSLIEKQFPDLSSCASTDCLQDFVINDILIPYLSDSDARIRIAASHAMVRMVSNLLCAPKNNLNLSLVVIKYASMTVDKGSGWKTSDVVKEWNTSNDLLSQNLAFVVKTLSKALRGARSKFETHGCCQAIYLLSERHPIAMAPFAWELLPYCDDAETSDIIPRGRTTVAGVTSSSNIVRKLSFSPTASMSIGVLGTVLSLVKSSWMTLDLLAHQESLKLCMNLLSGSAQRFIRMTAVTRSSMSLDEKEQHANVIKTQWHIFKGSAIAGYASQLMQHIARVLCLISHVVEQTSPAATASKIQISFPGQAKDRRSSPIPGIATPTNAQRPASSIQASPSGPLSSPRKFLMQRALQKSGTVTESDQTDKHASKVQDGMSTPQSSGDSKGLNESSYEKPEKLGSCHNNPHMLHLYEVLKGSYRNYQVSPVLKKQDKFMSFVQGILECFSLLLELTTFTEIVPCVDELLEYLRATVKIDSETTYLAMQQLLKSLFGTNAASQPELYTLPLSTKHLLETHCDATGSIPVASNSVIVDSMGSMYDSYFVAAVDRFFVSTDNRIGVTKGPAITAKSPISAFNIFKKLTKSPSSSSTSRMPIKLTRDKQQPVVPVQSYIRLFEPLVIHALKTYTTTSILSTQSQIFRVLNQLIRIRVNYSLLDADQVFIGFVLKQFEFLESGQIRDPCEFVGELFQFLVLLSYECYQPKSTKAKAIVEMPKIIQLCDGMMACGQPAKTHAIPSLKPIIHDLFIARSINRADVAHDLDTQREVVISMLLRLIQYPDVLELLGIVLRGYKDDEDRWRRLSRQIVDTLFPMLSKLQINLHSTADLQLLLDLLDAVAPLSLRPADVILKHLTSVVRLQGIDDYVKWMACCYSLTKMVVVLNSEDIILSRLQQLQLFDPASRIIPFTSNSDPLSGGYSPPNVSVKNEDEASSYLALFMFCVLRTAACQAVEVSQRVDADPKETELLIHIMVDYLKLMLGMCVSNKFKRVFAVARQWATDPTIDPHLSSMYTSITHDLSLLRYQHPTVVIHWHFMLQCLGYDDHEWWKTMYQPPSNNTPADNNLKCDQWNWTNELFASSALILFTELIFKSKQDGDHTDIALVCSLMKSNLTELINHANERPIKDLFSRISSDETMSAVFIQFVSQLLLDKKTALKTVQLKQIFSVLGNLSEKQSMAVLQFSLLYISQLKYLSLGRSLEVVILRHLKMTTSEVINSPTIMSLLAKFTTIPIHKSRYPSLTNAINSITNEKENTSNSNIASHVSHPLECSDTCIKEYVISKESYNIIVTDILHSSLSCGLPRDVSFITDLLNPLEPTETKKIMRDKEKFSIDALELCLRNAVSGATQRRSIYNEELQHSFEVPSPEIQSKTLIRFVDVSMEVLMDYISDELKVIESKCPIKTICFQNEHANDKSSCIDYDMDSSPVVPNDLTSIIPILRCIKTILLPCVFRRHCWKRLVNFDDIIKLTVYSVLRYCHAYKQGLSERLELKDIMECFGIVLHCPEAQHALNSPLLALMLSKCISGIHNLISCSLKRCNDQPLAACVADCFQSCAVLKSKDYEDFNLACHQISELVHCMRLELSESDRNILLPANLLRPYRTIIIGLARVRWFNSYARLPPLVWKLAWQPSPEGIFQSELPPLPVDILKEKDVLQEFVTRINTLGWISRTQFEETWAALLGVISSPPISDEISFEEEIESVQSTCLAVKSISSLLLDTTLAPCAGNPIVSLYSTLHRRRDYAFLSTRTGKKLSSIRKALEQEFRMTNYTLTGQKIQLASPDLLVPLMPTLLSPKFRKHQIYQGCLNEEGLFATNLESWRKWPSYGIGQISSTALRTRLVSSDVTEDTDSDDSDSLVIQVKEIQSRAKVIGFDIRSCLQFLLELFEQWLSVFVIPKSPLMLKMEAVKSVCLLSDLVLEMNHFEWILSVLLEFQMNHPIEDDVMAVYVLPTICKALGVLKTEGSIAERICKTIEISLKSPHIPLQISALSGALYILESLLASTNAVLLPILNDYVGRHITNPMDNITVLSQKLALHVWSTAFYVIEVTPPEIQDMVFVAKVIEVSLSLLTVSVCDIPSIIANTLLRGLERLVISNSLSRSECERFAKTAASIISTGNSDKLVSSLCLLSTVMYTGNEIDQLGSVIADSVPMDTLVADVRLVVMERLGVLFNRIRRGLESEARIIANVLPRMLLDFLSVQEIMNKVISELLSSQQPYPEIIAEILFEVCDSLQRQGQQDQVRDWVLLSLGSFVQRSPKEMAVWSLSCCLTSASSNPWIQSLFSFILKRKGYYELIDRRLFCMAAIDFYTNQNLEMDQSQLFMSSFAPKSDNCEAYAELVGCLRHLH